MTIPFKFRNDYHYGIKGDIDHWIVGQVNRGYLVEANRNLG
jgi:hypothetical protein